MGGASNDVAGREPSASRGPGPGSDVMGWRTGGFLLAGSAAVSAAIAVFLWRFGFSPWLPAAWLGALALLVGAACPRGALTRVGAALREHPWWWAGLLCLACVPVFVRLANVSLAFTHPDEFALAWFSRQYSFRSTNFFGPIPPEPVWTFQSPSLYFVIQKAMLALLGFAPLDVKLSTLPFVLVTGVALFLGARALFGATVGALAVAVYAFLAPSVYAESFGVPNTMSTAFLVVFFVCAVDHYRRPAPGPSVAVGLTCALCYLAYSSSYSAAPLMLVVAALSILRAPGRLVAKTVAISLATALIVLLPFVIGAARSSDYFLHRITQTVPIAARALGEAVPPEDVSRARSQLAANWVANCRYFWRDDVGGTAGFNFGHRALLDPVSLVFLVAGVVLSFGMAGHRRELLPVLAFVAINILSLGFANPPPHITRLANLFPFIAMFMALPAAWVVRPGGAHRALRAVVAVGLLGTVVGCNLRHLGVAKSADVRQGREDYDDIKIALYLKEHCADEEIRVAAFGGFHLEYTLRFFLPGSTIVTDYHDHILRAFDRDRDRVYVILFPDEFNARFLGADPEGQLITNVSRKYSLFLSHVRR